MIQGASKFNDGVVLIKRHSAQLFADMPGG